jgi:hypothetical protein
MTDINDGSEPNTEDEVIDLFAEGADDLIIGEQDAPEGVASQEPGTEASVDAADDSSIPDKFKGKSAAEIAASYAELETEFGRRGNELGDLRKITDDILKAQLTPKSTENATLPEQVTSEDLLDNPQAVIDKAVANSPQVKALEADKANNALQASLARFKENHTDADKVIKDPRFLAWVSKNPLRAERWSKADASYDFDTASDIIDTYKEVAAVTQPAEDAQRADAKASVAAPAAGAGNPGTVTKGKFFRRAELMKLKTTDPHRYEKLQPQIILAYREGRVK